MKALERYENITKAKISRDNSSGMRLSASKCLDILVPFGWRDVHVRIPGMQFGPEIWSEVQANVGRDLASTGVVLGG